jgi:hypothetical protein
MVEEIERDGVSDGRVVVLPSYPHGGSELWRVSTGGCRPRESQRRRRPPRRDDPSGSQTPARQTGVAQARARRAARREGLRSGTRWRLKASERRCLATAATTAPNQRAHSPNQPSERANPSKPIHLGRDNHSSRAWIGYGRTWRGVGRLSCRSCNTLWLRQSSEIAVDRASHARCSRTVRRRSKRDPRALTAGCVPSSASGRRGAIEAPFGIVGGEHERLP